MSERELAYRVSVLGQSDFARDLRGIQDLIRRSAAEEVAVTQVAARSRRKTRDDEARHQAALLRTQIALEKARARESEREYQRAEKAKTKAAQTEEKQRQRGALTEQKASIRAKLDETRAFERAEKEKTRIALREAKQRQREENDVQRSVARAQEATMRHMMREREKAQRHAEQLQRKGEREAFIAQRDEMFNRKRFFRGVGSGIAQGVFGAVNAGVGYAVGAGRSVLHAVGAMDAFDVGDIVAERMAARKLMRSAAIEDRKAGTAFGAGEFNEEQGLLKVRSTALKYGISQRDLLGAIDAASEKGSGADAVKNLDRIAMQATAMGTDATTISKMRAQLKMSSKVATGEELSDDKIDAMMAKMHFIGKTGVFRAEDIAKESESLFSSFVKGGGNLEQGFDRYISFANEARKSVGSGSMARTAIMGVQDAIAKKESKINALGIKTRDADGGQRDFVEVVMDVIAKTGGKGAEFNKIFDPSKSGKAIATMVTRFNEASGFGKDVKAGRAGMTALLAGDASLKDATVAEMQKDAELRMDDQGVRIKKAVESIRQALADKLTPVLELIAKKAPEWAEKFKGLVDWVSGNPLKAAGVAVAGNALINGGKAAALPIGGAALRYFGDLFAQKTMGGMGKTLGAAVGSVGGAISRVGATNVYVVGVAPGVSFGGGGGLPGLGGAGGGALGMGGLGGVGAAIGGAAIGAALIYTLAPIIQDAIEKGRNSTFSTEAYNAGKTEIEQDRKRNKLTEGNVDAVLGGFATDSEKEDAFATLEKLAPSIAAKLKSGEMSTVDAGTEIAKGQAETGVGPLAGKVGADGKFTTSKLNAEDLTKVIEALNALASSAAQAQKAMNGITPPNVSMLQVIPKR